MTEAHSEPGRAEERQLRQRISELNLDLSRTKEKNEKLTATLRSAREELLRQREAMSQLGKPPNAFGVFLGHAPENAADVMLSGRKMRVGISPDYDARNLQPGQEVLLSDTQLVVAALDYVKTGEIGSVKEFLPLDRVLVSTRADEEHVIQLSGQLLDSRLRVGDSITIDTRTGYGYEVVPRAEVQQLVLEEAPDIQYEDIGGLGPQIEAIRDAVELPFLHPDLYREHGLKPPKGILLYGPPGCGKTLIAKAVAKSLSERAAERAKLEHTEFPPGVRHGLFLNIKGPELLDKYVGETERHIRLIFARAREKATNGVPVVVFFDEMDSLFRTRGTGVSSDVETTIVPQLLSEIDGVEQLDNVIVIGASNREDMIDPAILRPGRLDVKIKIQRPDAEAALDIFSKYLTADLPIHPDDLRENGNDPEGTIRAIAERTVEKMYAEDESNQFLEVTYANGEKEVLYFKDFNSGAVIQNIVDRAKKAAINQFLTTGERGLRVEHLLDAVTDEFREHEDLPNTTNPDDWARISGKKGERIVYIRTIIQTPDGKGREPGKSIDTATSTGQYL